MKLRHAAALALVGLYLMVPPLYEQGTDFKAPFSQERHHAFDTAEACEKARAALKHCGEVLNAAAKGSVVEACGFAGQPRPLKDQTQDIFQRQMAEQYMQSRCVLIDGSTDDPSLKGN